MYECRQCLCVCVRACACVCACVIRWKQTVIKYGNIRSSWSISYSTSKKEINFWLKRNYKELHKNWNKISKWAQVAGKTIRRFFVIFLIKLFLQSKCIWMKRKPLCHHWKVLNEKQNPLIFPGLSENQLLCASTLMQIDYNCFVTDT